MATIPATLEFGISEFASGRTVSLRISPEPGATKSPKPLVYAGRPRAGKPEIGTCRGCARVLTLVAVTAALILGPNSMSQTGTRLPGVALLEPRANSPEPEPAMGHLTNAALKPTNPFETDSIQVGLPGSFPNATAIDSQGGRLFVGLDPNYLLVVNVSDDSIMATVNVSPLTDPTSVVFDSWTDDVYVGSSSSNGISIVSGSNFSVVGLIGGGLVAVGGMIFDNRTGDVWVATAYSAGELAIINGSSRVVVENLSLYAEYPQAIAFDYVSGDIIFGGLGFTLYGYLAAVNGTSHVLDWGTTLPMGGVQDGLIYLQSTDTVVISEATSIIVVHANNGSIGRYLSIGSSLGAMAVDDLTNELFVSDFGANEVRVVAIANFTPVANLSVLSGPGGIEFDSRLDEILVVDVRSNHITVLNSTNLAIAKSFSVALGTSALAFDPDIGAIVAVGSDEILAISETSHEVVRSEPVGNNPLGVAFDSRDQSVLVSDSDQGEVSILNSNSLITERLVRVDSTPIGIAFDEVTGLAFVACWASNRVDAFYPANGTVVASIPVGLNPNTLTIDSSTGKLFVTDLSNDSVSVIQISTLKLVGSIALPRYSSPVGIVLDPANSQLYVADRDGGNISIVSTVTNSVVRTLRVGGSPWGVVFDPLVSDILVSDACASVGSFQPCMNNITIIDTATDAIVGVTHASSPKFGVFSPASGADYFASVYGGSITILTPSPQYEVNVSESGLPIGTPWWANVSGANFSASAGFIITLDLYNGSYTVVTGVKMGDGVWFSHPRSGVLIVSGQSPPDFEVQFEPSPNYLVSFVSSGLPATMTWWVDLGGTNLSANSGSPLNFSLANGTYFYSDGPATGGGDFASHPRSGSIRVLGGVTGALVIEFALSPDFAITFKEFGLPSGQEWSVRIGNASIYSTTPFLTFLEPNGTLVFQLPDSGDRIPSPSRGDLVVNGTATTFDVRFISSGAPGSVSWPGYLEAALLGALIGAGSCWVYFACTQRRAFSKTESDTGDSVGSPPPI